MSDLASFISSLGLVDSVRDLAGEIGGGEDSGTPQPTIKRQAYVTAIDWSTKTVSIRYPESSTSISGVAFVGSYSPFVDDTVWVEAIGSDRLVTGTAAIGGTDPPTGFIGVWPSTSPPSGWLICDGSAIPTQYVALRAFVGANTPSISTTDLPGGFRFIIHV